MTLNEFLDKAIFINNDNEQQFILLINNKKELNPFKGIEHVEEWKNVKGDDNVIYSIDLYKIVNEQELKQSLSTVIFIQFLNIVDNAIETISNSSINKELGVQ